METKITDNEIIKALECCSASDCNNCPYDKHKVCGVELSKDALDLINRQKEQIKKLENIERFATKTIEKQSAEIEKLNVELVGMRGACESYKMHYDNAQAEIEKLQKEKEFHRKTITEIINNLVKETAKNITKIKHNSLCETETYKGGE